MAEIHVERKPKRSAGSWIAGLVVLLLLAAAGWYFFLGPGQAYLDGGGAAVGDDVSAPAGAVPAGGEDGR